MKNYLLCLIGISLAVSQTSCSHHADVPKPDHIIVVIEENHGFDELIGSSNAPFINQLAKEGALFTNAHGVVHPSQPNYLALFSGSTQGVTDDKCLEKYNALHYLQPGSFITEEGFYI